MVVARQLRLPHGIRGGGAAKGAVEAREVANLRRSEVEKDASDAILRDVAEARSGGRTVASQVRQRGPHPLRIHPFFPFIQTTKLNNDKIGCARMHQDQCASLLLAIDFAMSTYAVM